MVLLLMGRGSTHLQSAWICLTCGLSEPSSIQHIIEKMKFSQPNLTQFKLVMCWIDSRDGTHFL